MRTTDEALLALAAELVRRPSVTPEDAGCQELIGERLQRLGFHCESLRFGDVDNLWATWGDVGPLFVFAGHTDVVPVGDEAAWEHPPFSAHVDAEFLHGRGAADMKGSLAAMIVAVERLFADAPPAGRIGFLITSDEEGPAVHGTRAVMDELDRRGVQIDYCVVGEPSSGPVLGDVVRIGRRGSLGARLVVRGIQGHVAYPQLARNPVHEALAALDRLARERWDDGNEAFPATTFQISNIAAGTGATNVIPGTLTVDFNFRFSTASTATELRTRTEAILGDAGLDHEISWNLSGEPFLTARGTLVDATRAALKRVAGVEPELSTGGGTSDGRFIAPRGAQLVELGPCNATIHQVDERVPLAQLKTLAATYEAILGELLGREQAA